MTTRITHRFSKITRVSGDLLPEDRIVVSQQEGSVKKTANGTVDELYKFVEGQIITEGIGSIVNIGNGIIGKGSVQDPVRLDPQWLNQTLARKDHFTITRVGNRKTRYLPIARFPMFESATFNSTLNRTPYTGTIEASGELRIIQPATKAYTLSVGDWGTAGTVDSLQIIERKMQPNNLPEGYSVKGLLTKSKNAVVLVLGRLANPLIEEFWYASLTEGSLAEESYYNFTKITDRTSTLGGVIANNSVACAHTPLGGRMFFVALPSGNPNTGIEIRAYTLGDPATANTISELVNWNVSSYAGLFTGQNRIRVSDKFLGTGSEKCELLDKTNGSITVEVLNGGPSTTRIQCIHNPDDDNDLYMIIRREHVLVQAGVKQTYVHDISLKLNANYKTGIASAIAINNYLNNKPTVDTGWVYTNKRATFRSEGLGITDSEVMSILADGSVMLVGDTANGTEAGLIQLRKSAAGWGVVNMIDIDTAVKSGNLGAPQILDPRPQYTNADYTYKVFISSPINVYLNGTNYTVPAQVLDLTNERNAATPTVFTDMPYGKGEYAGLTLRVVYIYLQQAGKVIQLVKTHQKITESVTNTLLAVVYFGASPVATALYGQAYSRMGKYRPSYVPMGGAVPVSYDHPGEAPKDFWLQEASFGDTAPTFWADSTATTTQLKYAADGRIVYIRVNMASHLSGRQFRLEFNGIDLGTKTFTGSPLIWQVTVVNKTGNIVEQAATLHDLVINMEVARTYLSITPYPFNTDVVSTSDGDDIVTAVINNNPCYIRVRGYDLAVGDVFTVTITNPSGGTTNLGQKTYQGYPMFFPYPTSMVGVHQVTTRNITRNQTPPNITFNVVPAITYYTPGQYNLSIPAGRTVEITLIGGGAGGGGSIHNYSSSNYWVSNLGADGKDSKIAINANQNLSTTALVAGGGKGGIGANWGNGSSYSNGSAGEAGVVSGSNTAFTIISSVNGIKPPIESRWTRQVGGTTVAPEVVATNNGAGGAGAWGVGDEQWSYGGGGGSGAKLIARFTNNQPTNVELTLTVGDFGAGWKKTAVTNGNNGDDGVPGYGIVEYV